MRVRLLPGMLLSGAAGTFAFRYPGVHGAPGSAPPLEKPILRTRAFGRKQSGRAWDGAAFPRPVLRQAKLSCIIKSA
jgi:hypothetical protein